MAPPGLPAGGRQPPAAQLSLGATGGGRRQRWVDRRQRAAAAPSRPRQRRAVPRRSTSAAADALPSCAARACSRSRVSLWARASAGAAAGSPPDQAPARRRPRERARWAARGPLNRSRRRAGAAGSSRPKPSQPAAGQRLEPHLGAGVRRHDHVALAGVDADVVRGARPRAHEDEVAGRSCSAAIGCAHATTARPPSAGRAAGRRPRRRRSRPGREQSKPPSARLSPPHTYGQPTCAAAAATTAAAAGQAVQVDRPEARRRQRGGVGRRPARARARQPARSPAAGRRPRTVTSRRPPAAPRRATSRQRHQPAPLPARRRRPPGAAAAWPAPGSAPARGPAASAAMSAARCAPAPAWSIRPGASRHPAGTSSRSSTATPASPDLPALAHRGTPRPAAGRRQPGSRHGSGTRTTSRSPSRRWRAGAQRRRQRPALGDEHRRLVGDPLGRDPRPHTSSAAAPPAPHRASSTAQRDQLDAGLAALPSPRTTGADAASAGATPGITARHAHVHAHRPPPALHLAGRPASGRAARPARPRPPARGRPAPPARPAGRRAAAETASSPTSTPASAAGPAPAPPAAGAVSTLACPRVARSTGPRYGERVTEPDARGVPDRDDASALLRSQPMSEERRRAEQLLGRGTAVRPLLVLQARPRLPALPEAEREAARAEFAAVVEEHGERFPIRAYTMFGIRARRRLHAVEGVGAAGGLPGAGDGPARRPRSAPTWRRRTPTSR